MDKQKFKQRLSSVAEDLFNLEVNTIVVDRISAVKMPAPRHALIDIAKAYKYNMIVMRVDVALSDHKLGSYEAFQLLGKEAKSWLNDFKQRCVAGTQTDADQQSVYLFDRINTKCAQICAMMKRLEARGVDDWDNTMGREGADSADRMYLDPKDMLLIRKTWELGTAQIAMQTVVQLDGDVITRINPAYAQAGWLGLHQAHHKGLRVSMSMWKEMVALVETLLAKGMSMLGIR